jgi:hypothetical protein
LNPSSSALLAGFDVPGQQLSLGRGRIDARRPFAAALGQVLPHRRPRALERAVDRRRARLEHVRGLPGRAAEHVAQDQHRALERRETLDRDEVRELDGLPLDGGGRRVVALAGQLLEQLVGIGLQP